MTPANDQDLLIDEAVSLLREAMTNSKMRAALPSQEQQESAIHETLSMVAIVISETPVPENNTGIITIARSATKRFK